MSTLTRPQLDQMKDKARKLVFEECDECRAKPGMPDLCKGCLHNRFIISELQSRLDKNLGRVEPCGFCYEIALGVRMDCPHHKEMGR